LRSPNFRIGFQKDALNASWLANLFEARTKIGAWKEEYNEERPRGSSVFGTAGICAPQLEGRKEAEVMSSGILASYDAMRGGRGRSMASGSSIFNPRE